MSDLEGYDGPIRWSRDLDSVRRLSYGLPRRPERLRCVECGSIAEGGARGWRAPLTIDNEVAVYCPKCAREEFGRA